MLLKASHLAIFCLLTLSCSSADARRRSRIDLPVQNATDSTTVAAEKLEKENVEAEKLEATTVQSSDVGEESVSEGNSSEESPSYEDCDLDNISFEMITG